MAAAVFNAMADPARARAVSAGTAPAAAVHPEVAAAMRDAGVPLGGGAPQRLSDTLARTAQVLVTMGCGDRCPVVPGARVEDWPLDDPKGQPPDVVSRIRDEIRARVAALVVRDGVARP
jgi:arsenate reductase